MGGAGAPPADDPASGPAISSYRQRSDKTISTPSLNLNEMVIRSREKQSRNAPSNLTNLLPKVTFDSDAWVGHSHVYIIVQAYVKSSVCPVNQVKEHTSNSS